MQRALMLLNLYAHEAVQYKLKNSLKTKKVHFFCFWAYMGQSHSQKGKNHISFLPMNQFYLPKDHFLKFLQKIFFELAIL